MSNGIIFRDHSDDVLRRFQEAKERALEAVGLQAEGYAKKACVVDTGRLRNSISHRVDDDDVYIGTNVEYAPFVELGTGRFYPTGRKTPWTYVDDKGVGHVTTGSRARAFLKPAVTEHTKTYRRILENQFKGE